MNTLLADVFADARETLRDRADVVAVIVTGIEQAIARRFHDDRNDIAFAELIAGTHEHEDGYLLRVPFHELGLSYMMLVKVSTHDDIRAELGRRGIEFVTYEEPDAVPTLFIEYGV